MFEGINGYGVVPKEGVDPDKAMRHLAACMRSFEPKHEHKMAGVACLMATWFEDYIKDYTEVEENE